MKKRFTLLRGGIAGIFLICSAMAFNLNGQTIHEVIVTNNVFTPSDITINVGDEVKWINSEGYHNVNATTSTYPNNPESFGNDPSTGWTFSHVFTLPGIYDYQCDPHESLGMVGTVTVVESGNLIISFSGMGPHGGQDLWLRVEDDDTNEEIYRDVTTVEENFLLAIPGAVAGNSYQIEFFADHNQNDHYDAPGDDHAWSIEVQDLVLEDTVKFTHNVDFDDIEWEHRAIINLSGMGPHVGQEIYFALIETSSGEIVDRKSEIVSESFSVELEELMPETAYHIDFFADHNDNGYYDAPGDDHAWRLEIASANGDEEFDFTHNTDFTDIEWKHRLRVRFDGMDPHIGDMLTLYLRDMESGENIETLVIDAIDEASFDLESYAIEIGQSYNVDFFADLNGNGIYDPPGTDHAWRIEVNNVMGDVDMEFSHNTDFTDIEESATGIFVKDQGDVKFRIYPIPASNQLFIESESIIHSIKLHSLTGAVIKELSGNQDYPSRISLSEVPTGIYLLKVTDSRGNFDVQRIVKQ